MRFRIWMLGPLAGFLLLWLWVFSFWYRGVLILWPWPVGAGLVAFLLSAALTEPLIWIWGKPGLWNIAALHYCILLLLWELLYSLVGRLVPIDVPACRILRYSSALPLASTIVLLIGGRASIRKVRRQDYTVTTTKAIPTQGYRVALLADIHYGLLKNRSTMEELAAELTAAELDAVILGGDIVDERTTPEQLSEIFRILGQIRCRLGVYYIYGNHDTAQYSAYPPFSADELRRVIEKNGIRILADEALRLEEGLTLIGRQDRSLGAAPIRELVARADPKDFLLLADHQPYAFEEKAAAGIDLQLSGHTHRGQIFPLGLICRLIRFDDLEYGLAKWGGMTAIVTSGVSGWGYPIRTEGQSEYVLIHIRPA